MIKDNVKAIIDNQQIKGYNKYGKTVDDANLSDVEWIQHTQEELADAMIYLESLKKQLRKERVETIHKLNIKEVTDIEVNVMKEVIEKLKDLINGDTIHTMQIDAGIMIAIDVIDCMIEETQN